MTTLKYIGTHQPTEMLVEVEEIEVGRLLDSGEYKKLSDLSIKKVEVKKELPNRKWKEIEIYDWIKANKIAINYIPSRDRKDDVLNKLKEKGYINDINE